MYSPDLEFFNAVFGMANTDDPASVLKREMNVSGVIPMEYVGFSCCGDALDFETPPVAPHPAMDKTKTPVATNTFFKGHVLSF